MNRQFTEEKKIQMATDIKKKKAQNDKQVREMQIKVTMKKIMH